MDPDAALERLLSWARREVESDAGDDATEAAEAAIALDKWIRRGGFLPGRWRSDERA